MFSRHRFSFFRGWTKQCKKSRCNGYTWTVYIFSVFHSHPYTQQKKHLVKGEEAKVKVKNKKKVLFKPKNIRERCAKSRMNVNGFFFSFSEEKFFLATLLLFQFYEFKISLEEVKEFNIKLFLFNYKLLVCPGGRNRKILQKVYHNSIKYAWKSWVWLIVHVCDKLINFPHECALGIGLNFSFLMSWDSSLPGIRLMSIILGFFQSFVLLWYFFFLS